MNSPLLSVIVCVYNGADVIEEQLDALAAQVADVSWELVVAENRSTDSTYQLLTERQASFPVPLRIVRAWERQGVAHARNVGAKASLGRLLAFCDADDRVGPGWVQAVADGLARFDMIGGERRELLTPFTSDAPVVGPPGLDGGFNGPIVPGNNFACRRDVFFDVGGMDEAFPPYGMDDVELSARVNAAGYRIGFQREMLVYFRRTEGLRTLARKVYLSGRAEYLVWSLYPHYFSRRRRLSAILIEPARVVLRGAWSAGRTGELPVRPIVRAVVGAVAHVREHVATRAGTRVPRRAMLSAGDDVKRLE